MESSTIIRRLQEGGTNELAVLFMRLRPHIRQMVDVRLDKRLHSRVDASDIVQETYVRALQGLPTYLEAPKMDPLTWLRLIGKHLIAEVHRHHFRSKRSPDREHHKDTEHSDLLVARVADSIHSIGSVIDQKQLIERVQAALQSLSLNDREIIEMRHVDELTIQEAAVSLDITFEAAKKRYHRALTRFREITNESSALMSPEAQAT